MFKKNDKGLEKTVATFATTIATVTVIKMLPVVAQAAIVLVVNLAFITLGAQIFAALSIKVCRGQVRKHPKWVSAYLTLSLLIASISLGLMLIWTYRGFMTAVWIERMVDRKACIILGWSLELALMVVFWHWVSWPSFLRKHSRRLAEAKKLAAAQYHRYEQEEARRAAIKRAREERIHAEMYETHTEVSAESILEAVKRLQEGQNLLSNVSAEDAEAVKAIMERQFGEGTKVEDMVSIPADHYEILRQNRPEVEMPMASVRGGKIRYARPSRARKGQTISFADLRRRRARKVAGSQAQRLIEHQNKVGVRIAE